MVAAAAAAVVVVVVEGGCADLGRLRRENVVVITAARRQENTRVSMASEGDLKGHWKPIWGDRGNIGVHMITTRVSGLEGRLGKEAEIHFAALPLSS